MNCGLGIRPELFGSVFEVRPNVGFLEAHSENYFGESIARARLLELREAYPISLHGVGLSLGRADHLDETHLKQLSALVDEVDPLFVSEHLAWSAYSHRHVPDLLPLPLTEQALQIMCAHIDQMQTALGRQILIENPSNYLLFDQLQIPEPEFLNTLADRTGCGLLLDVNNVHVSACNTHRNSQDFIESLNSSAIQQYHLAGYTEVSREHEGESETVLIDTHNQTVFPPVWELFEKTLALHGAKPTLIEWDSDFPEFSVMLEECDKANHRLSAAGNNALQQASQPAPAGAPTVDLSQHQTQFLDAVFAQSDSMDLVLPEYQHRLGVYQNNVFAAIQDYLAEVFPATRGVLGADYFKQMAQRFIEFEPPAQGNIHLYGESLPTVLSHFEALESLPYLRNLLDYEWALHEAYFAPVSASIDPSTMSQDELLRLPIRFNQSIRLIDSEYPIFQIHRQSLPDYQDEVAIDLGQSQDKLLVYKTHHQVQTLLLTVEQLSLLESIKNNKNLLQAIEDLQGSIAADTMSSTLAMVLEHRMLATAA